MSILSTTIQKQLRPLFAALPRPVGLLMFTRAGADGAREACEETRALVEELAALSGGKIHVDIDDVDHHPAQARLYKIDKTPAIVVLGGESGTQDFGMRFFGSPAGYEFGTLIEDIRMASTGATELAKETVEALARLTRPLHLQVFVTPTCPYCPKAALLAHKLAMAGDSVTADAIDATEFPELANRYQVYGVPRTVINDTVHIEGAVPEAVLMARLAPLLKAA